MNQGDRGQGPAHVRNPRPGTLHGPQTRANDGLTAPNCLCLPKTRTYWHVRTYEDMRFSKKLPGSAVNLLCLHCRPPLLSSFRFLVRSWYNASRIDTRAQNPGLRRHELELGVVPRSKPLRNQSQHREKEPIHTMSFRSAKPAQRRGNTWYLTTPIFLPPRCAYRKLVLIGM